MHLSFYSQSALKLQTESHTLAHNIPAWLDYMIVNYAVKIYVNITYRWSATEVCLLILAGAAPVWCGYMAAVSRT